MDVLLEKILDTSTDTTLKGKEYQDKPGFAVFSKYLVSLCSKIKKTSMPGKYWVSFKLFSDLLELSGNFSTQ